MSHGSLSSGATARKVQALRAKLGHPVIDADGHWLEFVPALARHLRKAGIDDERLSHVFVGSAGRGSNTWARLSPAERARMRAMRPGWWGNPARNTLDLATAQLPRLLHERMDEIGLDLSVIYPSIGLVFPHIPDDDLRRRACRALNRYHAEVFAAFADRLLPVAVIPMHTPEEAIEELEHAVQDLRLRTILIAAFVRRPVPGTKAGGETSWLDTFGIDSAHDYDPFWRRCLELKVPVAAHSHGLGWGSRRSISSYVYNHIGSFTSSAEALSKSLFLGGVTRRFPDLRFAFLEGGAAWACQLYNDLIGHWTKRNGEAVQLYNPALADRALFRELFERYGRQDFGSLEISLEPSEPRQWVFDEWVPDPLEKALGIDGSDPSMLDEFARAEIRSPEDIRDRFVPSFYFGCEADDPLIALAFNTSLNPLGARLNVLFGSDIGHWDVPDMAEVLLDAHESVDEQRLSPGQFRDLVYTNPTRFYTDVNPDFFRDTAIEAAVARDLVAAGSAP